MENTTTTAPAAPKDYSGLYVPGAIIIAALVIAGGLYFGLKQSSVGDASGQQPIAVDIKDVKTDGTDPFIGNPNAPVVMAAWEDYQCPWCKAFETGGVQGINTPAALPKLVAEYVKAGKLKIVFKDFAVLSEDSMTAAEYARAVWDLYPDQYFAWRTAMYDAQDEEHGGFGDAASIDALIKKQFSQMSLTKIKAQLVSKKEAYTAAIEANHTEAQTFGINGTPGFIVGKTLIEGARPVAAFVSAINEEL